MNFHVSPVRLDRPVRLVLTTVFAVIAVARSASAQVPTGGLPSPSQAQQMLQANPGLVDQLRQRIGDSGLTPDQIRARLAAAGYPQDFLDPYLAGGDTTKAVSPGSNVLQAVQLLGIMGQTDLDSLLAMTDSGRAALDAQYAESVRKAGGALRIFGLDIFRRSNTVFQPNLGGPVDENYRLGPGDVLVLVLTGDVELAYSLEVTREGFIVIPQVGQLFVANLTLEQMRNLLYTRLGKVYSGVRRGPGATTKFDVTVARVRTNQIYVVGEVSRPGSYQMASTGTVLSALYAAGGITDNGSFRRVDVRRGGKLVDSLDLYDYLLRGDNSNDIRLETGDVVFVGVHGSRVKATGQLVRPAIYELRPTETLRDLIQFSGGFRPDALRRRVQIDRILPPEQRPAGGGGRDRVVIDLASDQFIDGKGPPFPMAPADSVTVFAVAGRVSSFITVNGNVWIAGVEGFTTGMKLSDAIRLAGGPRPDVYLGQILISRLLPDSTRIQLRSAFTDSAGAVSPDLPLQQDDEITIFSRTSFRPDRYVVVTGAVLNAGRVPYAEGITLRDAVLLAGGVAQDALLSRAQIARLPADRTGGVMATTIEVSLDSTYLLDRAPDGRYLGPPGLPAAAAGAPEVTLQPYDNVLIFRQPDWELQRMVAITGQVVYPGHYTLVNRTERLLDLINRAGGLTKEAYPGGVHFNRTQGRAGRVGIDLPRVLEDSTFRDNLILQGGDSVHVPEYDPIVFVSGAVNAPVAVSYVPGKNIDFYVGAAGGYADNGDSKKAFTVQPDGKVQSVKRKFLIPDKVPDPRAGAKVIVPVKVERPPSNNLALFATLASIIASLATIVIVAKQ
jgi:polysaccharide export outer membrane protein